MLALASGLAASAQTTTTTTNFTVDASVPDNDASGLASAKIVSTPISYITKLKVNLKLSGTFNDNIYCYLTHGSTNAILLNRVGRSANGSQGYSDKGFDLVFDDASTNGDVHVYQTTTGILSGPLTNSWVADGRRTNPINVLAGDPRSSLLNVFNGMDPNGEWVLFVADMAAGDLYTLNNWGLEITGYTAPGIVSAPANASAKSSSGTANFTVTAAGSSSLNSKPISAVTASTVLANKAPIVKDITMGAVENHSCSLLLDKVAANCFEPDGDPMFLSVSATSTNGGRVALTAAGIIYTPMQNFVGEDRFRYTVDDGRGGVSAATIVVEVYPADALTPNTTGLLMSGGVFQVRFAGIPGFTYHIERTGSLSPANWTEIGSVVAPEDGQIVFDDTNPPAGSGFYRTASQLP